MQRSYFSPGSRSLEEKVLLEGIPLFSPAGTRSQRTPFLFENERRGKITFLPAVDTFASYEEW